MLAYWLRLATVWYHALNRVFDLLVLAWHQARSLRRFGRDLRNLGCALRQPRIWRDPISAVGAYWRLLRTLPRLAGRRFEANRERVDRVYASLERLAATRVPSRRFLRSGSPARQLQAIIVKQRFRRELGLSLEDRVVASLAGYSEASELLRDFLEFCRCPAVACTDSVEQMCAAVPVFEQVARRSLGTGQVPPRGLFSAFQFPASSWLRGIGPSQTMLRCNYWRAARTIKGTYDCRTAEELRQVVDEAPRWLRQTFEAELAELQYPDVPSLLGADMHLHACAVVIRLVRDVAGDGTPAPGLPAVVAESFADLRRQFRSRMA